MDPEILSTMKRLRRQMLLHCYIYYTLDDNILSDHEWQKRANELHTLQQQHGWNIDFYDNIFKNFNGQSGYWFPTNKEGLDPNVDRIARRLLEYQDQIRKYPDAVKTACGWYSQTMMSEKKSLDKIS